MMPSNTLSIKQETYFAEYITASTCILVPIEQYGCQKNMPKKVLVTLFYIYISRKT